MSKLILLLLALVTVSEQNFLSFQEASQKLELKEMIQGAPYSNNVNWKGYELSSPHIITKISWSSEDINQFAIFEGSNEQNFRDAVPLYMFKEKPSTNSVEIKVASSFKYIRYIAPVKTNAIMTSIEIFGYESATNGQNEAFQPTNIPLIVVNTEGKIDLKNKKSQTDCNIIIINSGKITTKQTGTIRIRGNSSKDLEKKSYQLDFNEKVSVLDMPAKAKKWGLLANHMDKSLIRNLVAYKISSLLGQKYVAACRSIDLIVDGSFDGNYIICDKIEKGEGRVELDTLDESMNNSPQITGGYLMEIDGFADQEQYHFTSQKGVKVTIKYPDATPTQISYLKSWFDDIEENIYTNQIVDNIDLETFSQIFILNEFCADIDSVWSSYYVTKQRNDDKLHFGPGWDFDLSLDNDNRLYPTNSKEKWIFNFGLSSGTFRQFISKLMSCDKTLNAVQQKWKEVTNSALTKENIFKFIDEQIKYIDESQKLNFKRWDVLNKILQYEAVARGSYEEEIKHLKEYIQERFTVFGNMLLQATTSSFEVQAELGWQGGWNPADWGNFPMDGNLPWSNPGDGNNPWNGNPGDGNWPWNNPGDGNNPWNGNPGDGNNPWNGNPGDGNNPWNGNPGDGNNPWNGNPGDGNNPWNGNNGNNPWNGNNGNNQWNGNNGNNQWNGNNDGNNQWNNNQWNGNNGNNQWNGNNP